MLRKAGYEVFVYHDRTSSRVCVGSFKSADDPDANRLRSLMTPSGNSAQFYHEFRGQRGEGQAGEPLDPRAVVDSDHGAPGRLTATARREAATLSPAPPIRLVLATRNRKKGGEMQGLLLPPWEPNPTLDRLRVETLDEHPEVGDVDEDAPTFSGNARKRRPNSRPGRRGMLGPRRRLGPRRFDALGAAAPRHVFSARYSGTHGDDAANNRKLLDELVGVPPEGRGAAFVCALALADPTGTIRAESEGACTAAGSIGLSFRASAGSAGMTRSSLIPKSITGPSASCPPW